VNEPEAIDAMLQAKTIAVIGLSENPQKPSHYVPAYMQKHGYRILPVNPLVKSVLREKAYPSLRDLPEKPDVVNVFRLSKFIPAIVDEMLELGFKKIWVQQGIINIDAARKAEAGGIQVVMDRCMMVEHRYSKLA
jgi:uncharacterized protein